MVVTVSTIPLVEAFGGTQRSWIIVSIIFAVIALILLLVCFFNIEERVVIEAAKTQKVSVGQNLKALFSNQYWAICLGLWGLHGHDEHSDRYDRDLLLQIYFRQRKFI